MSDSIPRNWRTRQQRYSLKAEVCNTCHKHIFPPRDVCPYCAAEYKDWRTTVEGQPPLMSTVQLLAATRCLETLWADAHKLEGEQRRGKERC